MSQELPTLEQRRQQRQVLVESKIVFEGPDAQLRIYDTYEAAIGVPLHSDQLLYCGMVQGRKVMHHPQQAAGEVFLPHESYVMPPGEVVKIDFPDAAEHNPTTCLAIEISKQKIEALSERMRNLYQPAIQDQCQYAPTIIHRHHTQDTQYLLERLVRIFTNDEPDKEMLLELGVTELTIKLLREQGRDLLMALCHRDPEASGVIAAMHYLEQTLHEPLDLEQLCRRACMSRSRLYVEFKKHLGCTPGEYQLQQRMKHAAKAIRAGASVSQACYNFGFTDLSHFSRRFRRFYGCSPSEFRMQHS